MARIVIADEAGACYGVERALEMVRRAAGEAEGPVSTLGPLIHNPRVVSDLAARGVSVADGPVVPAGSTLLLRTHGVTPEEEAAARGAGARVLDATCPFVKKVHVSAERLVREGYRVIVVGEAGHPEVVATLAHAEGAVVVGTPEEAEGLDRCRKLGVVVQTTMARSRLAQVCGVLLGKADELRVYNTICEATSGHQSACARLAGEADVMVVIGGRNSANTTHLAEIAAECCERTHHIEGEDELDPSWFEGADVIGITAGASTPAEQIETVRAAIATMVGGA